MWAYISYFLQYCNFTDTRGVKFDKNGNKKAKVAVFRKKRSQKNIEVLERSLKLLEFCIWKSVGTMLLVHALACGFTGPGFESCLCQVKFSAAIR